MILLNRLMRSLRLSQRWPEVIELLTC